MTRNIAILLFAMLISYMSSFASGQIDDESVNICPAGAETELWIIGGQSNTHCGRIKEDARQIHEDIWMLNMDGTWMPAAEPLHRFYATDDPGMKEPFFDIFGSGFTEEKYRESREEMQKDPTNAALLGSGFGLPFAVKLNQEIHKPIGLIPCGLGGSEMRHWDPARRDEPNSLYHFMLKQVRSSGGNVRGILWYQGESDASTERAGRYEQTMLNFIDSVRNDLDEPELAFLIVQLGRYYTFEKDNSGEAWSMIQDIQRRLPLLRKNVYVTTAVDLPLDDPIHVSAEGHQVLGGRLAEMALKHVYEKKNRGDQILPESIEKIDASLITNAPCSGKIDAWRITFSGVSGRLNGNPFPTGFSIINPQADDKPIQFYRTEIDADDGSAVNLYVVAPNGLGDKLMICYAAGMNSFVNITDEKNMAVPAFGPVILPLGEENVSLK